MLMGTRYVFCTAIGLAFGAIARVGVMGNVFTYLPILLVLLAAVCADAS